MCCYCCRSGSSDGLLLPEATPLSSLLHKIFVDLVDQVAFLKALWKLRRRMS